MTTRNREPSFIERFGSQLEARFDEGFSVNLSTGPTTGRIYSHKPYLTYAEWEDTKLDEKAVRDIQKRALQAYTSGAGRISIDSDGDLYAEV